MIYVNIVLLVALAIRLLRDAQDYWRRAWSGNPEEDFLSLPGAIATFALAALALFTAFWMRP